MTKLAGGTYWRGQMALFALALQFGCGGSDGGPKLPFGNDAGTAGADAGVDSGGCLTLSPLGPPRTQTAHMRLYFSVTDERGRPVSGLLHEAGGQEDFVASEDGAALDVFESAFKVAPPSSTILEIPIVLVLDLSRSIVDAGALEELKTAATAVVDSLATDQEMAILSFAGDVTVRSTFQTDKDALKAAIAAITMEDGISTNLYGALQQAYNLWDDGLVDGVTPTLTAGLAIAISDGNDTAGVATLEQVLASRGSKRTFFVRVGDELDPEIADTIATFEPIDATFDDITTGVQETLARVAAANDAIYVAEYCSPKRAGEHELLFTVKGNEDCIEASCEPSGAGPNCDGQGLFCLDHGSTHTCCPVEAPYYCPSVEKCYATEAAANSICGSQCNACGVADTTLPPGPAITIDFNANSFDDAQCDELFGN